MDTLLLKDYIDIVRKHTKVFWVFVIACTLLGFGLTYLIPKSYTSTVEIYIRHKGTGTTSTFYTYDGYYSTQASVQYTNTVAGFLDSLPAVANAALLVQNDPLYKAGSFKPVDLATQTDYLASFQKSISVKITAPQLITIAITTPDSLLSTLWAQSLGAVVTDNLKQLNQQGDSDFNIDSIHAPITQTNRLNVEIDSAIGLIIGIFLGFSAGFVIEAYKK